MFRTIQKEPSKILNKNEKPSIEGERKNKNFRLYFKKQKPSDSKKRE